MTLDEFMSQGEASGVMTLDEFMGVGAPEPSITDTPLYSGPTSPAMLASQEQAEAGFNYDAFRSAYEDETDPELKQQALIDWQLAERRQGVRRDMAAEEEAERMKLGMTPDQYQQYKTYRFEMEKGGPDQRLLNAPILRGVMGGAENVVSGTIAEPALRILGAGEAADQLGRSRMQNQRERRFVDTQQGKVSQYASDAAGLITEFLPTAPLGVPAYAQAATRAFSDAMVDQDSESLSGPAKVIRALVKGATTGGLTYAGGRLGGGTFEEMLGGKVAYKGIAKMARSYAAELGEEIGDLYAQAFVDRGFGLEGRLPTGEELLDTMAVVSLVQAGTVAATAGNDAPPIAKAAKEFIERPSRSTAAAAQVDQVATSQKARKSLASRVKELLSQPPQGGPQDEVRQAERRQEGRQGEIAPPILDQLSSKYPEVAQALSGETGTPEFDTVRAHTNVVLDRYQKSGASTGDAELDAALPLAIALHDIGKPAAVRAGDKGRQHEFTLPMLEQVMRAEGMSDRQVAFAKALVGQDIIGSVVRREMKPRSALGEMYDLAQQAGIPMSQFADVAFALYNADAGSYAGLAHLFDDQGRVPDYNYRSLEEAIYGEVRSIPWSVDYRGGRAGPAGSGVSGRAVYTHSSARDFTQFDPNKDSGKNLAGPGAYLLPAGNGEVAKLYREKAVAGALQILGANDRQRVRDAAERGDAAQLTRWADLALDRQRTSEDPKRAAAWGKVADLMAVVRQHGLGGVTLQFEFEPKKILDLGAIASNGREIPKDDLKAILLAAAEMNPNIVAELEAASNKYGHRARRGWIVYEMLKKSLGYANANKAIQAAGFDAIGFIHGGHRASGGAQHPVVVALDYNAPKRVTQAAAPSMSRAGVVPAAFFQAKFIGDSAQAITRKARRWIRQNFVSGGEQNEATRGLNFKRQGLINKHTVGMGQNIKELERVAKREYGIRSFKQIPANIAEEMDAALKDPAAMQQLALSRPDTAVALTKLRDHIDGLSQIVRDLPGVSAKLQMTIDANQGIYVTRTYRKFDDPENWKQKALNDQQIMADFAADVRQTAPGATDEEIGNLATILLNKDTTELGDTTGPTPRTNRYVDVLKKRKDLSPAVRALYGEYRDVFTNYAKSVDKMASLIANRQFVSELRDAGLMAGFMSGGKPARISGNVPKIKWQQFQQIQPGHTSQVNWQQIPQLEPLKDVYMPEEVAASINDIYTTNVTGAMMKAWLSVVAIPKAAKTVYSFPRSFVRNFTGNIPIALRNGVNPMKVFGGSKVAFWNDFLGKGDTQATRDKLQRYAELNLMEGVSVEALRDAAMRISSTVESYLAGVDAPTHVKKATRLTAKGYQAMDVAWKIATFEDYLPQYRKAYPNMPQGELEVMVAQIVRDLTPTYSAASKAARWWARSAPLGSFAMFNAEVIRTTANAARLTAEDLRSGNPVLRQMAYKRMIGSAIALGGFTAAVGAMLKWWFDISDEEEEAVRARVAPWQRNADLGLLRNNEGEIVVTDLSYNDPFSQFGSTFNAAVRGDFKGAAWEFAEPFLGEDLTVGTLISIVRNKQASGKPVYNTGLPADEQNRQIMQFTLKTARPGTMDIADRIGQAARGDALPGGRRRNLNNEIISALGGMRIENLDRENSDYYNNRRFNQRIKDSDLAIRELFFREPWDPQEVERLYRATEAERKKRMAEWRKYMDGSVVLGETDLYAKLVKDIGGKSRLMKLVYAGAYEPYQFRDTDFRKMLELSNGQERIETYARLMQELASTAASTGD